MDKTDPRFKELHNTMDSVFSQLHSEGVGASKKSAAVVSANDEQLLWDNNLIGMDSPRSLLNAVFFYVGLHFCLRGGQEHPKKSYLTRWVIGVLLDCEHMNAPQSHKKRQSQKHLWVLKCNPMTMLELTVILTFALIKQDKAKLYK